MKKKALLLLLLAIGLSVKGQAPYQSIVFNTTMPSDIVKTIIRETQNMGSVSYVETHTDRFFILDEGNIGQLRQSRIDIKYSINDFVIDNGTVYFCGVNTANGVGVFGHFDIYNFFHVVPAYTVTDFPFNTAFGTVASFDKMVTYTINNTRMFAAIGQTQFGARTVAEVRYEPAMLSCSYTTGELPVNSAEHIMGIALTDNYIVTAGYTTDNGNRYPCHRVFLRNNMFMSPGP